MLEVNSIIDRNEMLRYVGYGQQEIGAELDERIDAMIQLCLDTAQPRVAFSVFDVDWPSYRGSVVLEGTTLTLPGRAISEHLSGAKAVACMALTLGAAVERKLCQLEATSPTDALLFSAACNVLVERAADRAQEQVAQAAAERGLAPLRGRFSPGYEDFPLNIQPLFLTAVDAQRRIGLTATESCMLIPEKSITAVVGLWPVGYVFPGEAREAGACEVGEAGYVGGGRGAGEGSQANAAADEFPPEPAQSRRSCGICMRCAVEAGGRCILDPRQRDF